MKTSRSQRNRCPHSPVRGHHQMHHPILRFAGRAWFGFVLSAFVMTMTIRPALALCQWQTVRMAPLGAAAAADSVSALAFDDVWVVGSLSHPSGEERSFAQHFDGASWTSLPVPGIALTGVRSFSMTNAWAVGDKSVQGFIQTLAIHWDGSTWREVTTPNANNSTDVFTAIGASSSADVWAVGWYFDPNNHKTLTLAEHWNGSGWSLVPTPNVDLQNELLGVYAAATDDVWAVGYHDDVGGTDGDVLVEHWNGSTWAVLPPPKIPFTAFAGL